MDHYTTRLIFARLLIGVASCCTASALALDKSSIPPAEAQQDALDLIKEVYSQEWNEPKLRLALPAKLLQKATESTDDDASHYMLLHVAQNLASQAADAELAFKAIEAMAAKYDVDTYRLKGSALSGAAKSATTEQSVTVAKLALALVDEAVQRDDFVAAKFLGGLALDSARKGRDTTLVKDVVNRNREVKEVVEAYAEIEDAQATLKSSPVDPDANLAVGRYHCLVKGQWDRGLPMLALGSDEKLKGLAVKELRGVSDGDGQVTLGDGWWDLALGSEGVTKAQLEGRAAYWYRTALPGLSGLVKDRVEKRLAVAVPPADLKKERKQTWKPLMDGNTLKGWHKFGDGDWAVEGGAIVGRADKTQRQYGLLVSDGVFKDFTVRLKFKCLSGDSGFYIRTIIKDGDEAHGLQIQVGRSGSGVGGIFESYGRGWLNKPRPEVERQYTKDNDWNEMTITAHDGNVLVHVNGVKTAELKNDSSRPEGHFVLQLHRSSVMQVMFRDIEILED